MKSEKITEHPDHHHDEHQLMALLTRVSQLDLNAIQRASSVSLDWNYIYETACLLGVAPLFYHHLRNLRPVDLQDTPLMESFKTQYHLVMANNLYFGHELDKMAEKFFGHGIPCIGLKGIVLAREIYPSIALRPMFDIDILVKEEDLHAVGAIVRELGYQPLKNERPDKVQKYQYHTHYIKDSAAPVILEVHWSLGEKNRYGIDESGIWASAQKSPYGTYLEMSNDDTILYLSLHFFKHFLFKRLSWLCDIHEWIQQKEIHWDRVVERARSQSIATFLACTLIILERFYQMTIPVRPGEILHIGPVRKRILDWYLGEYDMFHPMVKNSWHIKRLFAFSCIDRMSDRLRFTWDVLRRDLE
ncbi:MAG: nucleotidyltransferase family protein [bacterium]